MSDSFNIYDAYACVRRVPPLPSSAEVLDRSALACKGTRFLGGAARSIGNIIVV